MAKIKTKTLKWIASTTPDVVGYKVYYNTNGEVDYLSTFVDVGNITSVVLPEGLAGFPTDVDGIVNFGITSYDEVGNESDMANVSAQLDFTVPLPVTNPEIV